MWNGFDIYYVYLDRIYWIISIFFACGEGSFGQRPRYPDDLVDLPARAFTHWQICTERSPKCLFV